MTDHNQNGNGKNTSKKGKKDKKDRRGEEAQPGHIDPATLSGDLNIPELDESYFTDFGDTEIANATTRVAAFKRIQNNVKGLLKWMSTVEERLAAVPDIDLRRVAREDIVPRRTKALGHLNRYLDHVDRLLKMGAVMAYVICRIGEHKKNRKECDDMIADFQERKILIKSVRDVGVMINYDFYILNPQLGFGPEDQQTIEESLRSLQQILKALVAQERAVEQQAIKRATTLTFEQFDKRETNGVYDLFVPSENWGEGEENHRGGGTLSLSIEAGLVTPVNASGGCKDATRNMIADKIKIPVEYVKGEKPTFSQASDLVQEYCPANRLTDKAKVANRLIALWYMIDRGRQHELIKQKNRLLKEKLTTQATISLDEYLGGENIDRKGGLVLISCDEAIEVEKDKKVSIYDLFFLLELTGSDGAWYDRVVDSPDHVREFLGPLSFNANLEGKGFHALPPNLGKVLRLVSLKRKHDREVEKGLARLPAKPADEPKPIAEEDKIPARPARISLASPVS